MKEGWRKEGETEEGDEKWREIETLFGGMTRRGYLEWRNNSGRCSREEEIKG